MAPTLYQTLWVTTGVTANPDIRTELAATKAEEEVKEENAKKVSSTAGSVAPQTTNRAPCFANAQPSTGAPWAPSC